MAVRIKRRHWDDYSGAVTLSVSFRNSFSLAPSSFFPLLAPAAEIMLISYRLPSTFSSKLFATRIQLVAVIIPNNTDCRYREFLFERYSTNIEIVSIKIKIHFIEDIFMEFLCHFVCCWILIHLDNIELVPNLFR